MHVEVIDFIKLDQNEGGNPTLVLPEDPDQWAANLKKRYREDGYIALLAKNIPDGGHTVEVYFGDSGMREVDLEPPAKYFGLILDREVFREMVKSLQLILEASDSE